MSVIDKFIILNILYITVASWSKFVLFKLLYLVNARYMSEP